MVVHPIVLLLLLLLLLLQMPLLKATAVVVLKAIIYLYQIQDHSPFLIIVQYQIPKDVVVRNLDVSNFIVNV
jgi:hypothetical protein